ncbi:MAG: VacJ family lipoprotein [Aquabacterium sp.]
MIIHHARVAAALLLGAIWAVNPARAQEASSKDPLEGINRVMFAINDAIDVAVLKPAAQAYTAVMPSWARTGVDNFFGNLGDLWSGVNHLLQAKPARALDHGLRFAVNSSLGLGGLLDIASEAGIERQREDFGQTLGWWGIGPGPYLVLPLLGPSTLRDTFAAPVDARGGLTGRIWHEEPDRYGVTLLSVLNLRANLLGTTRLLDDVALDKYVLVRDGYLSRRRNQVYDGDPPDEK